MYGTVKIGPLDYLWSCMDCRALVVDRDGHTRWHGRDTDTCPNDDLRCSCAVGKGHRKP